MLHDAAPSPGDATSGNESQGQQDGHSRIATAPNGNHQATPTLEVQSTGDATSATPKEMASNTCNKEALEAPTACHGLALHARLSSTEENEDKATGSPNVMGERRSPERAESVPGTRSTSPGQLSLLDLPSEIVDHILLLLPALDILHCQAVCSKLNSTIVSSVEIRYRVALEISGLENNKACSSLVTSERLERLLKGQEAWSRLQAQFVLPVEVLGRQSPKDYLDFRGGVCAPGVCGTSGVNYAILPEKEREDLRWKSVGLEEECFDIGSSSGEHDLIAILAKTPLQSMGMFEFSLHLRELSTGKPHPEATHSRIFVCKDECDPCGYDVQISGNNLALRLMFPRQDRTPDRVIVYDWRAGVPKATLVAQSRTYSGLAFLEESVLLLPNVRRWALEIWDLHQTASASTPSAPACVLELPHLAPMRSFSTIRCHAGTSPAGLKTSLRASRRATLEQRPYQCSAEESIVAFDVKIYREGVTRTYSFFVHRKSLLRVVESHGPREGPPSQADHDTTLGDSHRQTPIPWDQWGQKTTKWVDMEGMATSWTYRAAGQRTVLIPKPTVFSFPSSIVILDFNPWAFKKRRHALAQKQCVLDMLRERRESQRKQRKGPNAEVEEGPDGLESQVPTTGENVDGITTMKDGLPSSSRAGSIDSLGSSSTVASFTTQPEATHRLGASLEDESDDELSSLSRQIEQDTWALSESSTIDPEGDCFLFPVESELPCVRHSSIDQFTYNDVLMDEERILGIKTNLFGRVGAFDMHYFG